MREGRIEQIGTAEQIYAEPASRFVAGFIGKMNLLPGRVDDARLGRVRCDQHSLLVPPEALAGLLPGAPVTVLIRPETIGVGPANAPAPHGGNHLSARIDAITFLGAARRLGLDAGGQRLVADISTAGGPYRRGDSVTLAFPAAACRILAGGEPAGT
jgi:ABC-type Fe3+/spermidine/putrescine transport system ATPase subunit